MSWLSKKLGQMVLEAMREADAQVKRHSTLEGAQPTRDPFDNDQRDQLQLAIIKCSNGTVIRSTIYKPVVGPGSDWQHEVHIVKDEETVTDAIQRIMVLKKLE